jgi:2-oxoisovalerate dehydrogenase E1 component alpha subunit
MVMMNEADVVFNQAQRQSRISFYMTQLGEEAAGVGSAAAIKDHDLIFPQYREAGSFLWRGFSIQQMAHQLTGNIHDLGKARQMPVHYGSKELNIVTVSSPLCTQVPQASGAGYQYRIKGEDRIAITYFGEGAASEGDFHSALNFAATLRCQTMFFCRNNMYAISTPIDDQYAGDGIAVRGVAYGMPTIRVDGNDILAIYTACEQARELIIREKRPVLVEAISYRVGDHSTSDFSQRYRDEKEMVKWKELISKIKSPIDRFEKYLTRRGLAKPEDTAKFREEARTAVRDALKHSIEAKKPHIDELFNDVYDFIPKNL